LNLREKSRQLGWFVTLWLGGVLAVGVLALVIRLWLKT
jgi:hypothetical protein